MYLKEIKVNGFKSFAEKLEIILDDKTTCIVGPNGSGKSNIVDAVRWVLGEQSVKSLRGDGSMSDVIFVGSKSRKALNVATVELIFDNTDKYIETPFTEISIKRKVYRTGENEYYLNNEKCRLKDIVNLLLDTGIGKESFNIIGQGEVQRILSNSPVDRRVIFEEASGILKYKKRKEEALRKLDRTNHNLDRVNDIISELEVSIEPLKEQSKKAQEYLTNKDGLEKYEISLLAYDIEHSTNEMNNLKLRKEKLDKEIIILSNLSSTKDASIESESTKLVLLEKKLSEKQKELLIITEEAEKINGEKKLLKERNNQNIEDIELKTKIRMLLEEKGELEKNISIKEEEKQLIFAKRQKINEEINELKAALDKQMQMIKMLDEEDATLNRNCMINDQKQDSLTLELESGGNIPNSVKSVLKNTLLKGIHNTIGNILEVEDQYVRALETSISSSKNFIITEDEKGAVEALNYLKEKRLGRATFFPLSVIKGRRVDDKTLSELKNNPDFLCVLSDVLNYNPKYKEIVTNQLGTTLVSKDIDKANRLSKAVGGRYRIVTLDGDVVHIGGSLSGGSHYSSRSIITIKQEIQTLMKNKEFMKNQIKENIKKRKKIVESNNELEEKYFSRRSEMIILNQDNESKQSKLDELKNKYEDNKAAYESYESIEQNTFSEKEKELIDLYHLKNTTKEKLQLTIESLAKEIDEIKQLNEEKLAQKKLQLSELKMYEKELKEVEITLSRIDVSLDNMLLTLNEEYSLTYEKAKSEYKLDIEVDLAREKVHRYKNNIKRLGMVNLAAIEEYDRVNTRYEFLDGQRQDLLKATNTLLTIMNEMDEIMKDEFLETFERIRIEFKEVFKELFKGGGADLKLTDPENLLTTGVDIIASPPGKKLTTISLLSGGEKTLTAISLLFSILNIKSIPFCLFDEVEAALDDANVEEFGKYLDHYKNKTQFLIITHKKKTMEYADTLYGITMQESGVSKLVSVKLDAVQR